MDNTANTCYTIGHSNHSCSDFVKILDIYGINCVVDVRSIPFSKYTPQFNKGTIIKELKKHNIDYLYLGKKLGGRYEDPRLLSSEGIVDYKKVRQRKEFQEGIQRIIGLMTMGKKLTLMCSEKDPFDCHRFVLDSYALKKRGVKVFHILENGETISNEELEKKLIKKYGQRTLFDDYNTSIEEELDSYYEKRNWEIAYVPINNGDSL